MTVDFASETASGRFGSTGRVEDAGPATCRYTVAGSKLEGVLALEGRSGSLRLASTCTETFNSALAADVEGDVAIVDGNGAYASLTGAGRLIGCLVYDASLHGFSLDATCRVLM